MNGMTSAMTNVMSNALRPMTGTTLRLARPALARTSSASRTLATRVPVVGANWKCNPLHPDALPALIDNVRT